MSQLKFEENEFKNNSPSKMVSNNLSKSRKTKFILVVTFILLLVAIVYINFFFAKQTIPALPSTAKIININGEPPRLETPIPAQ